MFSQSQSKEDDLSKLSLDELYKKLEEAQKYVNRRTARNVDLNEVKLAPHTNLQMKLAIFYDQEVKKIESEIQNRTMPQSNNTCKN